MTSSCEIQLPYTRESLVYLLACGAHPDTCPYSHRVIARWCELFWNQFCDVDASDEIERLMPVLADVENQGITTQRQSLAPLPWKSTGCRLNGLQSGIAKSKKDITN
jgi:hypothetical protein